MDGAVEAELRERLCLPGARAEAGAPEQPLGVRHVELPAVGRAPPPRHLSSAARATPHHSLEAFLEEDAGLAAAVVVVVDALDLEAERLVEGDRALVDRRGHRPHDRPRRDRREEALVQLAAEPRPAVRRDRRRRSGCTPRRRCVCERKPQRNATTRPSSSATNEVSRKWTKKSFGSIAAIARPPHQSSITAITDA